MAHFGWPGGVADAVRWSYTSWVSNVGRQDHATCKITILQKPSLLSQGVNDRSAWPAVHQTTPPIHTVGIRLNLSHLTDDMVHIKGFRYSVCLTHCTVSCPMCPNLWLPALPMISFLHAVISHRCFRQLRLLPSSRLPKLLSFLVPRSV